MSFQRVSSLVRSGRRYIQSTRPKSSRTLQHAHILFKTPPARTPRTPSNIIPSALMRHVLLSQTTRGFTSTVRHYARYNRFGEKVYEPDEETLERMGQDSKNWRNWSWKRWLVVLVSGSAVSYIILHLEQVSETGRWRFMDYSFEEEAKFGETFLTEVEHEYAKTILPPSHPISRHVRRVVSRLLSASDLGALRDDPKMMTGQGQALTHELFQDDTVLSESGDSKSSETYGPTKKWSVFVVNDKNTVNAMAGPGVIVVFTGILPVCKDEAGLAAVLSHEIGHVVARHTAERLSFQVILFGVRAAFFAFGIDDIFGYIFQNYVLDLPNSRRQEQEADLIGLRLMSRACYDPMAAVHMFERLGKATGDRSASTNFLYTHPAGETRVKFLTKHLPEGYDIQAASPACVGIQEDFDRFRERLRSVKIDNHGNVEILE